MEKEYSYYNVKFSQEYIIQGLEKLESFLKNKKVNTYSLNLKVGNERWKFENDSEFFAEYSRNITYAHFEKVFDGYNHSFRLVYGTLGTDISIGAPSRDIIESVHQIFSQNADKCKLPNDKINQRKEILIFIGHGRNMQWRELKDHLQDKHNCKIIAYEVGARAGHTIRDILEEMLVKSSIAFLILTAEDEDKNGLLHARENVIHELGLFQGRLGFHKAIAIIEEETNEFSNINGIQQIRFSKGNIKETFGEVLATIKREYGLGVV